MATVREIQVEKWAERLAKQYRQGDFFAEVKSIVERLEELECDRSSRVQRASSDDSVLSLRVALQSLKSIL